MNQDGLMQELERILSGINAPGGAGAQNANPLNNSPAPLDLIDIVPIPRNADRMVRLRTLEEALEDFEKNDGSDGGMGYLIRVRPSRQPEVHGDSAPAPAQQPKAAVDGTYLSTGKLNTPFLLKNAELLFAANEFVLARKIYKAILASGENTAVALAGLARCLEAEGKFKEAQLHYEESVAYHSTLETYQGLAELFERQNLHAEAAETWGRALHLKDLTVRQRFELHKIAGFARMRAGKYEAAAEHFSKALEITPTADDIRASLGSALVKSGDIEQAQACFREAAAANPRNEQAHFGLGSCAMALGDKRAAHDYFAHTLNLNLNNPTAVFHLVKCAYELKNYATAAQILEQYIEIAPINTNLLYSLAGLQFHLSRFEDSKGTINRILQIAPNHSGAMELSGLIDRYLTPV